MSCAFTPKQCNVSLTRHALMAEDLVTKGDYDQALAVYDKAYLAYENAKDEFEMLYCLERMGRIRMELGEYGEAPQLF